MSKSYKAGDRVRLIRLDGTVADEVMTLHDVWGQEDSPRNASIMISGFEQFTHTDLIIREGDTSPIVVPDGGEWFIARGNNMGWGRAKTEKQAVANMRRNGSGKVTDYVVHRVSKWTQVDGIGGLNWPKGVEPVEIKRVSSKKGA